MNDTIENFASGMPDVQEHVIENEKQKQDAITQHKKEVKDDKGAAFDPSLHATDSDGNPKYTTSGRFQKIRGRGSKKSKDSVVNIQQSAESEKSTSEAQRRQVSAMATTYTELLGKLVGGDGAAFIKNEEYGVDERAQVFSGYDIYFEQKGLIDIPPGVALIMAIGSYGARVAMTKPAQNRTKNIWYVIKGKFGSWFGSNNKKGKKKDGKSSNTLANSRNNVVRKDNTSQTDSGELHEKKNTSSGT